MATRDRSDRGTRVLRMKKSFIQSGKGDHFGEENVHSFSMREIEGKRQKKESDREKKREGEKKESDKERRRK